uniref:hypothetical protein n=1 Tax=Kitasatospora sp. NBC_01519 TaxID=2903576 RepID=UPI002F915135
MSSRGVPDTRRPEAGRAVAGWVRELAARQAEDGHRTVLGRAADAVEQACRRAGVQAGG